MANTYSVVVEIAARDRATGAVTRAIRGISASFRGLEAASRKMEHIFKWTSGIAAGAAAGAGYAVSRWAREADELSKLARQIGVATELLDELGFAAERQGVPVEALHRGLRYMTRGLGGVQRGTGQMASALRKLDPELLRQMRRAKSVEKALDAVFRAMARAETPAKRAAIATAVFGRAGADLARMVDGGVEALEELRQRARELGVVTTEQGREAEAWQDSLEDLQRAARGMVTTVAAELIPAVRPYIDQLRDWIAAHRGVIAVRVREWLAAVIVQVKNAAAWWERNREAILQFGAQALGVLRFVANALGGVRGILYTLVSIWAAGRIVTLVSAVSSAIGGFVSAVRTAITIISGLGSAVVSLGTGLARLGPVIASASGGLGGIITTAGAATAALASATAGVYSLIRAWQEWASYRDYAAMVEETGHAVEAYRARRERERAEETAALGLEAAALGLPATVAYLPLRELREVVTAAREGRAIEVGGKIVIDVRGQGVRVVSVEGETVPIEVDVGRSRVGSKEAF